MEQNGLREVSGEWIDKDPSDNALRLAESMHMLLNKGRISAIDEYYTEEVRYQSSSESGSTEEMKADARMFLRAFPDLQATILDVFTDSDDEEVVTIRYEIAGTHSEAYETIPPTRQEVRTNGIGIAEFDGDDIAQLNVVFDNLGLLQNIGVLK